MTRYRQPKRALVIILALVLAVSSIFPVTLTLAAKQEEDTRVLVIYSSKDGEMDEHQRKLDMLIGGFTKNIEFINSHNVRKKDLKQVTHVFYFGQIEEKLPKRFITLFDDYTGYFIALGYNSEYLGDAFQFMDPLHEVGINEIVLMDGSEKTLDVGPEEAIEIELLDNEVDVLLEGRMVEEDCIHPVMVRQKKKYYFAFDNLLNDKDIMFGEGLQDIFPAQEEEEDVNPAYLRLEDVHPLVDPDKLQATADYLKEKKIPYMIAVIPVYTNPVTGEEHHFSDTPKLLKILKEMQKEGASIVLHGYTHQYRTSETGEGFEFWDVDNNRPVYTSADQTLEMKEKEDFSSVTLYEEYVDGLKRFEREYTESKIERGIEELVNYGLYPLAFEAPHYTMSQHGYQIVSQYFSTYVGQLQLSDDDWELMGSTPYITSPTFLHGMELLPETMGFVKKSDSQPIEKMIENAKRHQLTQGGMVAAFYHPYLGVDGLKELVTEMEKLPNLSWIDLKQRDITVTTDNITIATDEGEIVTEIDRGKLLFSSIDFPLYHIKQFVQRVVWGFAVAGGAAVVAFTVFTIAVNRRRMKVGG
ncbi:polysaccharide deacetylase family protein [Bacillus piscicola]|uniref:polysaccharide deacetylase family protein n=1 Tax=Bacillus piscicola TaxID=1632684 RepID=UPI001F09ABD2|nr:polysaccharide deacetylase family protein [Bacillus piscicola]